MGYKAVTIKKSAMSEGKDKRTYNSELHPMEE